MLGVRKACRELADSLRDIQRENDRLKADNARLREFASEAWELLTCNEPNFVWSGLQKKARELGIEVDG